MARSGMVNLIITWRRMVDDTSSAVWTDDSAQEILDRNRLDFWKEELVPSPALENGETVYKKYLSGYENLEEATSGTAAWRIYDADGETIGTANYSVDYVRGIITFSADQEGSARYLDGRSYDLAGAAADAWRERAANVHSYYDFQAGENRLSRAQWFEHCMRIAQFYDRHRRPMMVLFRRNDLA